METTYKALTDAVKDGAGLNKLSRMDLPLKMAYRFGRLMDSTRSANNAAAKEQAKLMAELEIGGPNAPQEKIVEFNERMTAFLETPITIWFEPVLMRDLEDLGVKLSPADMIALAPFLAVHEDDVEDWGLDG